MCCLPMVINADGIKLNGVAPSVWSLWYSFLAMIQLPCYSCAPPATTHPTTFVQDHLDELLQSAMPKPTEVPDDGIVRHAKVPKDLARDSRNPRRGGRQYIVSDLLGTERSFDTHRIAVQVASRHPLLSFKDGQTHRCTTDFVHMNNVSSEITRVGIMS